MHAGWLAAPCARQVLQDASPNPVIQLVLARTGSVRAYCVAVDSITGARSEPVTVQLTLQDDEDVSEEEVGGGRVWRGEGKLASGHVPMCTNSEGGLCDGTVRSNAAPLAFVDTLASGKRSL